jgi:glutamyl-tRNA synthetase/nondiscriminating glutamyl-tRNA synthetase
MRLRFAPSPTGQLHVGNARTALFNWLLARGSGAEFVLRIEDTDVERSTAESEATIFRDLRWLGLDWNEGPDIGGRCGPYRQSERFHLYESYAKEMLGAGSAYYCFCTPAELEADRAADLAAGRPVRYSGRCRNTPRQTAESRIAAGERPAIRFRVPEDREIVFRDIVRGDVRFRTDVIGDLIIMRSDGTPAYNFAVVIDDALMAITHVIRGEDHISNTPRQILLYETLGFTQPAFAHLSLVLGPDHAPLSKRHGATSVGEFRSKGYLPEALVNYLALVGWSPAEGGAEAELMPAAELARRFSLEAVNKSAGIFDQEKLAWVNRHYLKLASPERLADLSLPFFKLAGVELNPNPQGMLFLASAIPIASGAVDRLDQVPGRLAAIFDYAPERTLADAVVAEEMRADAARSVVRALAEQLATAPRLDRERFRAVANDVKVKTGHKARALFHPIRIALTGRAEGPELDLVIPAIDRGAELSPDAGLPRILGCRERATAFARALDAVAR